jgi:hypothetical protein
MNSMIHITAMTIIIMAIVMNMIIRVMRRAIQEAS